MNRVAIAQLRELNDDGTASFVVKTDRSDPMRLALPIRDWELLGRPERIRVTVEALDEVGKGDA